MTTIHCFVRHCWLSKNSEHKARPEWFDKESCLRRLLDTADDHTAVTVVFDGDPAGHFCERAGCEVVAVRGGTEARSFMELLGVVEQRCADGRISPRDIVYLCEDDYWHLPGWGDVLREGLTEYDYVSLYDHPDKYPGAPTVADYLWRRHPVVRVTKSSHWRSAVSTTNTYACRASLLLRDMDVHRSFSTIYQITRDHEKFLELWNRDRTLGTCIPAYATHCEEGCVAPVVCWPGQKKSV